jgi:MFS superfamily sulfate permease-like transporter
LIPTWLRGYDRRWLAADAIAGLTIWALMVPQAMAYAGIAGVPVQTGLYVMPLAVVGYALLGSSRHLFVGPSATVATLSASSVAVVATASTGSGEYVALTCALALMVGVIYVRAARWASSPLRAPGARGLHRRAPASTSRSASCEGGGNRRSRQETRSRCS